MVRAILAGTKTQTRRLLRIPEVVRAEDGDADLTTIAQRDDGAWRAWLTEYSDEGSVDVRCPYGKPGDRLWVRETWAVVPAPPSDLPRLCKVGPDGTGATWKTEWREEPTKYRWKPSIHMPRWASRITLEVTGVRVEPLQKISEEDAQAEGVEKGPSHRVYPSARAAIVSTYRAGFETAWKEINGARDGADWSANPWVWVVSFRRLP